MAFLSSSRTAFYFGRFPVFRYVFSILRRAMITGNVETTKYSAGTTNNDTTKITIEIIIVPVTLTLSFADNIVVCIEYLYGLPPDPSCPPLLPLPWP